MLLGIKYNIFAMVSTGCRCARVSPRPYTATPMQLALKMGRENRQL
jgi:hypothetical protein